MSQVGKPFWKPDVKERIEQIFYAYLADIRKSVEVEEFVNVLLTPTETINLPKRLGIAILLTKGADWRTIKDELHVSTGTVARIYEKLISKPHEKLKEFAGEILREDLPHQMHDPAPFRGKRAYRRKGEGVMMPHLRLPY